MDQDKKAVESTIEYQPGGSGYTYDGEEIIAMLTACTHATFHL